MQHTTCSYQALHPGGILVTYGSYATNRGGQNRPQVAAETRATRDRLAGQHEAGKRVEGYFIAGMKAAHQLMDHADAMGKIVLLP